MEINDFKILTNTMQQNTNKVCNIVDKCEMGLGHL